jgi:hypothetical protein
MLWPTTDTTAANSNDRRARHIGAIAIALPAPMPRTNILLARLMAAAIAAALLATAIFATGCKTGGGSGAGGGVAAAQGSSTDPATLGTLVKSGGAPLNFRISSAGTLRILDTTDNNALVVSTAIPSASNVNIDSARGVTVNGNVVKAGPLPAQHRYALYVNSNPQQ